MAAQNTDKLRKVARKWVGQVGAGGVENGTVTTVPLASTANLLTETAIMITIDRVDANGVLTPDKEEGIIGVVSGDNLISCLRGVEGTAQAHSAGAVVEVLWTAKNVNDIVDAILAEHSQSGAHTTDTINEKTEDAGVTVDGLKIKDGRIAGWDGWIEAGETWTYSSVDDPTGVITVPSGAVSKYSVGMRIKFTNGGSIIYGIITAVADTSLTFLHEIDPTDSQALHLMANSAITNPYYSTQKAPLGFPLDPSKWAVTLNVTENKTQSSPTAGVWYNVGSLSINFPIGIWRVWYNAFISFQASSVYLGSVLLTLSTTNNSESDSYFTTEIAFAHQTSGRTNMYCNVSREKALSLASKTTYYINMKTLDPSLTYIRLWGDPPATFQAVCAYL